MFEQSLAIYHDIGDHYHSVQMLDRLAQLDCIRGHYDLASVHLDEAVQLCKDLQGRQVEILGFAQGKRALYLCEFGRAKTLTEQFLQEHTKGEPHLLAPVILTQLGLIELHRRAFGAAEVHFRTALEYCDRVATIETVVDAENGLALLACCQDNFAVASPHFKTSLTSLEKLDDWVRTAECLEGLAWVIAQQSAAEAATTLLGAANMLRDSVGAPLPPCDPKRYDDVLNAVRSGLSADQFSTAWNTGKTFSRDEAIAFALAL